MLKVRNIRVHQIENLDSESSDLHRYLVGITEIMERGEQAHQSSLTHVRCRQMNQHTRNVLDDLCTEHFQIVPLSVFIDFPLLYSMDDTHFDA